MEATILLVMSMLLAYMTMKFQTNIILGAISLKKNIFHLTQPKFRLNFYCITNKKINLKRNISLLF